MIEKTPDPNRRRYLILGVTNGVVKRKYRHLLEVACAMKFQSNVPTKFWGEFILIECYLVNQMPTFILNWKTPFEM